MPYSLVLVLVSFLSLLGLFIPTSNNTWLAYFLGLIGGLILALNYRGEFLSTINKTSPKRTSRWSASYGGVAGIVILNVVGLVLGKDIQEIFASFCVGMLPSLFLAFGLMAVSLEKHSKIKLVIYIIGTLTISLIIFIILQNRKNYKTYTNNIFDFKFSYENASTLFETNDPSYPYLLLVSLKNDNDLETLHYFTLEINDGGCKQLEGFLKNEQVSDLSISGVWAKTIEGLGAYDTYSRQVCLPYNGNSFNFYNQYPAKISPEGQRQIRKKFDKVVSSFEFY